MLSVYVQDTVVHQENVDHYAACDVYSEQSRIFKKWGGGGGGGALPLPLPSADPRDVM